MNNASAMPRLLPRAPPCIPWPAQGMGGGAWLKLKRIRSLGTQRGFWPKTLHGRHVLFFEERKTKKKIMNEQNPLHKNGSEIRNRSFQEFRVPSLTKSILRQSREYLCPLTIDREMINIFDLFSEKHFREKV